MADIAKTENTYHSFVLIDDWQPTNLQLFHVPHCLGEIIVLAAAVDFVSHHITRRSAARIALFRAIEESVSRCPYFIGSAEDFRGRAISGFTLVARKRAGVSKYIYLVTPDRRGTERRRSSRDGNPCASGALGTR